MPADRDTALWSFLWGAGCRRLPLSDASAAPAIAEQIIDGPDELWAILDEARADGGVMEQFARRALGFLIDRGLLERWLRDAVGDVAAARATAEIRMHGGAVKVARWLGRCAPPRARTREAPSPRERAEWARFAETAREAAGRAGDRSVRGRLLAACAAIQEEHLGDGAAALALLEQAFADEPCDETAAHLERLGHALGREEEVARCFRGHDAGPPVRLVTLAPPGVGAEEAAGPPAVDFDHALATLGEPERERARMARTSTSTSNGSESGSESGTSEREPVSAPDEPSRIAELVAEQRAILWREPGRVEAYRALRRIYSHFGRRDEVWCLCAALDCLRAASPDEAAWLARHPPRPPREPLLAREAWDAWVQHPAAPPTVGLLFAVIERTVAVRLGEPLARLGLVRAARADLSTGGGPAALIGRCAGVLDAHPPDLHLRDGRVGLRLLNTHDGAQLVPSLIAGVDFAAEPDPARQAFIAARLVTLLRPEFYLRCLLPPAGLRAVFLAAHAFVRSEVAVPGEDAEAVAAWLAWFEESMHFELRERVALAVRRHAESGSRALEQPASAGLAKHHFDAESWVAGVDFTADRAALLLGGDLTSGSRLLGHEAPLPVGAFEGQARQSGLLQGPTGAPPAERVRELLLWAISDHYFALRRHLGCAIA